MNNIGVGVQASDIGIHELEEAQDKKKKKHAEDNLSVNRKEGVNKSTAKETTKQVQVAGNNLTVVRNTNHSIKQALDNLSDFFAGLNPQFVDAFNKHPLARNSRLDAQSFACRKEENPIVTWLNNNAVEDLVIFSQWQCGKSMQEGMKSLSTMLQVAKDTARVANAQHMKAILDYAEKLTAQQQFQGSWWNFFIKLAMFVMAVLSVIATVVTMGGAVGAVVGVIGGIAAFIAFTEVVRVVVIKCGGKGLTFGQAIVKMLTPMFQYFLSDKSSKEAEDEAKKLVGYTIGILCLVGDASMLTDAIALTLPGKDQVHNQSVAGYITMALSAVIAILTIAAACSNMAKTGIAAGLREFTKALNMIKSYYPYMSSVQTACAVIVESYNLVMMDALYSADATNKRSVAASGKSQDIIEVLLSDLKRLMELSKEIWLGQSKVLKSAMEAKTQVNRGI